MAVMADQLSQRICQEIVSSEESYVHHLELVIRQFETPLKESGIVPDHVGVMIFGNIQQILSINKELLNALYRTSVGEAFESITPFLKLYSSYARSHEKALQTLMEWDQKSAMFSTFRRTGEAAPEMGGLKLNALLITPVQRIPRYKLLLEELLKHTKGNDLDYTKIEKAAEEMSATADFINSHVRDYENNQKILQIQKRLSGENPPNLVEPGRKLLKEGQLTRLSTKCRRSFRRMFYLFSDILMYAKVEMNGQLSCSRILPLHKCDVAKIADINGEKRNSGSTKKIIKITCMDVTLLMKSDVDLILNDWMSALKRAIGVYRQDRRTLRKESSGRRPLRGKQFARMQNAIPSALDQRRSREVESSPTNKMKSVKRTLAALNCTPVLSRRATRRESLL